MNRRSIMFQVMAPTIALVVVGLVSVGVLTGWLRYTATSDLLARKVALASELSREGVGEALSDLDARGVAQVLSPLLADADVRAVVVRETDGRDFFARGPAGLRALADTDAHRLTAGRTSQVFREGRYVVSATPLAHVELGRSRPLGQLVIVYDTQAVAADVWGVLGGLVLLRVAVTITLVTFLYFSIRRIARPLQQLSATMHELSHGRLEAPVAGLDRKDEVGAMARAVQVFKENAIQLRGSEAERERLLEARLRAEAANHAKGEFLANMSHELRTPLTSIIGFSELTAALPDLSPVAGRYVERVRNASGALLTLVNDILDFSKLEAGQAALHPRPSDVEALARSTLDLFAPQAEAKRLDLGLAADGFDGRRLLVDPDRIRQILLNLVGNAVKFTDRGGVTLDLRYDPGRERLRVSVADTGPGVPPEHQDKLFQRFSQVDGSTARAHGGTGLGLAICKGLVEAMGGEIGLDSRPGDGSVFWFELPAPVAATAPEAEEAAREGGVIAGVRVLVADDHPANRELTRLYLLAASAEVTEAEDGQAALDTASARPFDVILMDVRMPRLDGPAVLAKLRSQPGPNDKTPILAFTADVEAGEVGRLIELGFDGVIAKPIDAARLFAAVGAAVVDLAHPNLGEARHGG